MGAEGCASERRSLVVAPRVALRNGLVEPGTRRASLPEPSAALGHKRPDRGAASKQARGD